MAGSLMVKSDTVNVLDARSSRALSAKQTVCKKHGIVGSVGTQRKRCKICNKEAVIKRRKKVKAALVDYKGGKCSRCGYAKCLAALEFHHRDPAEKERGLSQKGATISLARLKVEADKCELLCANCHREVHAE